MESTLEKYLKDFVWSKISEAIYLHLDDTIVLRPQNKRGSMFLASLWVKILQHESNYPPIRFRYRSRTIDGVNHLVLETGEVRFSVNMTSGALSLQGKFVYDWFSGRFKKLLDNFDPNFGKIWKFVPTDPGKLHVVEESVTDDYEKAETESYMLLLNRGQPMDREFEEKLKVHSQMYLVDSIGDMSLSKPVWSVDELTRQLHLLKCGGNFDTSSFIYPFWRSLLHHWFRKRNASIYIASPMLDAERLREIVEAALDPAASADLKALYVQFKCDPTTDTNASSVQKKVLDRFDQNQQVIIEYKVFRRMTFPFQNLLSSFVAVVEANNTAMVFTTSACFHHFDFDSGRVASVVCLQMAADAFRDRFLKPLESTHFVSSLSK